MDGRNPSAVKTEPLPNTQCYYSCSVPTLPPGAGGSAFQLGWTMAGLHGPLLNRRDRSSGHLPTLNELGATERVPLAIEEVKVVLSQLGSVLNIVGRSAPSVGGLVAPYNTDAFKDAVLALHVDVLGRLEANDSELATAYSLGRALSDTCWLPHDRETVMDALGRWRARELSGWIDDVRTVVPDQAAGAVRASLRWWSEWIAAFDQVPGGWDSSRPLVLTALRHQGERWRMLLSDEQSAQSMLTLDGYVLAADAALVRVRHALRRVLARFWLPIGIALLLTAGLVWLAVNETAGAAKVWSTFATLAAGLGVTGSSIRTALQKVASTAGKPLWAISEGEAIAAEITHLPGST